jgi:uncharacterized protein (TIGR04141 family)
MATTTKSRPFSMYLLKPGFDASNALQPGHKLEPTSATGLPPNATIYILDAQPKPPWWQKYFEVQEELLQEYKGALVFLPLASRCFALSFGQVSHYLNDTAYEYDFGLRVTLNSLDPKELKSADMVEPGLAKRKRTQVPISTELTFLDFDANSEIIKSLTGKVKPEYKELFANATGSSSLKVSLKLEPNELPGICEKLLTLYEKEDFKTAFPNIQNISPVRDPSVISKLDNLLIKALQSSSLDDRPTLTIPDIIDYRDNTCCVFTGEGKTSEIFPDISLEQFYEFLDESALASLTTEKLKEYRMLLTDVEGYPSGSYNLYRALLFDTKVPGEQVLYHLCEGAWYKVEDDFLHQLTTYLDGKCEVTDLCPYDHDETKNGKAVYSEGAYNAAVPVWSNKFVCLDQTDIAPSGQTGVEPCDLYSTKNDELASCGYRGVFYHVKISTRSAQLSHQFNQGINALELITLNPLAREKLKAVIADNLNGNDEAVYLKPFDNSDFKVVFGIITHKDESRRSANLPLFSKISLKRIMQRLELMKVPAVLTFIRDDSPKKKGHQKYSFFLVEVVLLPNGRTAVRPVEGQGLDASATVKGCAKQVGESAPGTRFSLAIKVLSDGGLRSSHNWPFEPVS